MRACLYFLVVTVFYGNTDDIGTISFDTLAYAKKLKEVGFAELQAEVQAEAMAGSINDQLATRHDLSELEISLKRELKELELRLMLRLESMIVAGIAVVTTLVKIL